MSQKLYNQTVFKLISEQIKRMHGGHLSKQDGELGIEIEVEGQRLPVGVADFTRYWRDENDNSLRGESREYILTKPINKVHIAEAIAELKALFLANKARVNDSMNTSVHIHLNCQTLTFRQLATLAVTYYCLEHLLMEYCGEEREGNKFCLRATDAEGLIDYLMGIYRTGRYYNLQADAYRYAGLNFTSIPKYGSLEFRGMRGLLDWGGIIEWTDIITAIRDFSLNYDKPSDVIFLMSHTSPLAFLKRVLPNHWTKFYGMTNFEQRIMDGVRVSQDLAFCLQWEDDAPKAAVSRETAKPLPKRPGIKRAIRRPLEDAEVQEWDWADRPVAELPPIPMPPPAPHPRINDLIGQERAIAARRALQNIWDQQRRIIIDED